MANVFLIVLSQSFVEDAVKLLVIRFIPLDPADLEEWMTDPEEWVNMEERDNDLWEFELRVSLVYSLSRTKLIPPYRLICHISIRLRSCRFRKDRG